MVWPFSLRVLARGGVEGFEAGDEGFGVLMAPRYWCAGVVAEEFVGFGFGRAGRIGRDDVL